MKTNSESSLIYSHNGVTAPHVKPTDLVDYTKLKCYNIIIETREIEAITPPNLFPILYIFYIRKTFGGISVRQEEKPYGAIRIEVLHKIGDC